MPAAPTGRDAETDPPKTSTILIATWAVSTLFWSIFTEPPRTFPARVLLFQPLWIVRIIIGDLTWAQDLGLFLSLHSAYSLWIGAWKIVTVADLTWLDIRNDALRVYIQVFTLLAGCGLLAGMIVYRDQQLKTKEPGGRFREERIEESLLPPLLIASRTSHSRTFPQKHAFSYSYLFAGVPVGSQGRVGNVLSVDAQHPAWFDVRGQDYLKRGTDEYGLGEKLKRYLHSQGVTDRDYAFAYLVTAPRVFGYSFNPVSFWYLYDSETYLKYMILEVNNTFDERRMYLLKSDNTQTVEFGSQEKHSSKSTVFTDTWNKDFHVSPFNSRKGSYSLKAVDPLAAFQETGQVKIDNTIVLRSSKASPKLIARVWSEGHPTDPSKVTTSELASFLLRWWWVGFATFPRIVWEAQKLFFRRNLHVWYRPETTVYSIGRPYTSDEQALEELFRSFLAEAVETATKPLRVIYEPAHNETEEIVFYSPGFTYGEDHDFTLTLKILSPAFYSRFVHYAHAKEAFDRECLATDEKNQTLSITGAHALPALLDAMRSVSQNSKTDSKPFNPLHGIRWNLLRRLRCPPAAASYPSRQDPAYSIQDIRSFQFSELDRYLQATHTDADIHRRIAVKLFIAERALFGVPALVALCDWTVRAVLILAGLAFANSGDAFDILRPRSIVRADLVKTGLMLLFANGVHIWRFIKG